MPYALRFINVDSKGIWIYGLPKDLLYNEAKIVKDTLIIKMGPVNGVRARAVLPIDPKKFSYSWSDKKDLDARFLHLDLLLDLPAVMAPFQASLALWRKNVIINYRCEMIINSIRKTAELRPELLNLIARLLHAVFGYEKFKKALGEVLKARTDEPEEATFLRF
ncbi:MAG: hypothetical protein WC268_04715 [Patescibacteria group bacterium]